MSNFNLEFNEKEYENILKLSSTNLYLALAKYESLLTEYPNFYFAYPSYISLLITAGRLIEAERVLILLDNIDIQGELGRSDEVIEKFNANIIYNKIRLYLFKHEYEKCFELCRRNKELLDKYDKRIGDAAIICKKKLWNNEKILDADRYQAKQMKKYDEQLFLEHNQKYFNNSGEKGYFNSDFNYKEIIEEIKKLIPNDKKIYEKIAYNKYIFKYDQCGRFENRIVDYFAAITIYDTDEIILMYPVNYGENFHYIDLNYLKKEEEPKVKRLSQIDKFNQRYNLK